MDKEEKDTGIASINEKITYRCGSCGWIGKNTDMGLCPSCYRDGLEELY